MESIISSCVAALTSKDKTFLSYHFFCSCPLRCWAWNRWCDMAMAWFLDLNCWRQWWRILVCTLVSLFCKQTLLVPKEGCILWKLGKLQRCCGCLLFPFQFLLILLESVLTGRYFVLLSPYIILLFDGKYNKFLCCCTNKQGQNISFIPFFLLVSTTLLSLEQMMWHGYGLISWLKLLKAVMVDFGMYPCLFVLQTDPACSWRRLYFVEAGKVAKMLWVFAFSFSIPSHSSWECIYQEVFPVLLSPFIILLFDG